MEDDGISTQAAKELGLNELAPEVYKDLFQPAVREVGKNLIHVAKAVSIATAPFELTVWGYDRMRELLTTTLTRKLSTIPPERIVTPDLNVAGPILNNYPFVSQEDSLKEMYENLLAAAMDENTKNKAHPSFSYLIQQLSPEEAKLIKYLPAVENGWLCREISALNGSHMETESLEIQFNELCIAAGLKDEEMFSSYMENLIRLRIIYKDTYPAISEGAFAMYKGNIGDGYEIHDGLAISSYGWSFIEACVDERVGRTVKA